MRGCVFVCIIKVHRIMTIIKLVVIILMTMYQWAAFFLSSCIRTSISYLLFFLLVCRSSACSVQRNNEVIFQRYWGSLVNEQFPLDACCTVVIAPSSYCCRCNSYLWNWFKFQFILNADDGAPKKNRNTPRIKRVEKDERGTKCNEKGKKK